MSKSSSDDEPKDLGRGRTQTKIQARAFDEIAERLFDLPESVRDKFPGSSALASALLIKRTNMVKSGLRRHLRHIAGLLRDEGFTADDLESYIDGGRLAVISDTGPDLEALRETLCDPATLGPGTHWVFQAGCALHEAFHARYSNFGYDFYSGWHGKSSSSAGYPGAGIVPLLNADSYTTIAMDLS